LPTPLASRVARKAAEIRTMANFSTGQAVQVYSKSTGAWVEAMVLETTPDASVRVRYGNLQKLIPVELQTAMLKQKSVESENAGSPPSSGMNCVAGQLVAGQAVEVFSKSQNHWVAAIVREVLANGAVHVQYRDNQQLFKVVPPELQATMLRSAAASASSSIRDARPSPTPQSSASAGAAHGAAARAEQTLHNSAPSACAGPSEAVVVAAGQAQAGSSTPGSGVPSHVASLVAESQRLRATIQEQQRQISVLNAQQQELALAEQQAPVEHGGECWKCAVCTFENIEGLGECEMCGASRARSVGQAQPSRTRTSASEAVNTFGKRTNPFSGYPLNGDAAPGLQMVPSSVRRPEGPKQTTLDRHIVPCHGPPDLKPHDHREQSDAEEIAEVAHVDLVEIAMPETAASADAALPPAVRLPRSMHDKLRPYQREGVAWMWTLYHAKHGGILADDMGLGKTVQACGIIQAARLNEGMHILVLVPVTLLDQWAKEIHRWCPDCPVYIYHGSSSHRARALRAVMRPRGGVLLTSYNLISRVDDQRLLQVSVSGHSTSTGWLGGSRPTAAQKPWDVVICDEAHVMRTISTLLGKALRNIRANCRILLTGTPVQNAMQDLWALMDFAQPGLLGNHATFVKCFNDPIEKGSVRGAPASAVALKKHLTEQLWQLTKPHLLRRTKSSVGLIAAAQDGQIVPHVATPSNGIGDFTSSKALPPKFETVVWLMPTQEQIKAYQKALETSDVISEANAKAKLGVEVFQAIGLLKRLCNHPALGLPTSKPGAWREFLSVTAEGLMDARELLRFEGAVSSRKPKPKAKAQSRASAAAAAAAATATEPTEGAPEPEDAQADSLAAEGAEPGKAVERMLNKLKKDVDSVVSYSAKLRCLSSMLPILISHGHRVLIFSQGLKMMDLVEICVLRRLNISYLRIDGKADVATRNEKVEKFQTEDRYKCLLLTTRVGGYGLNLTSADRVIILDPAWNPATDIQAVDRAHRIGQEREVRTYRLIMNGLIEDKMFRLQVHKMGLTKTALETKQQHRYFTADEIHGLFEWTDPAVGETRNLLVEKHGEEDLSGCDGANEGWLKAGPAVGLSNFSNLYSSLVRDEEELDDCSPEVREMKAKLRVVEQTAERAAENRLQLEGRLTTAQQGLEDAVEQGADAAGARSEAADRLKQAQVELLQARRQEASAERQVEKAVQTQCVAQKNKASMDESRVSAEAAAATAQDQVAQAGNLLAAAEKSLEQAMVDIESRVTAISSASSTSGDEGGRVGAPSAALNAARKVLDRASKMFSAVQVGHASATEAQADLLRAYASASECEADVTIATKHSNAPGIVPLKTAQAASRTAEKESARAEKVAEKAIQHLAAAHEQSSGVVSELRDTLNWLADALHGVDENTLQRHIKAVQQELRASVRNVGSTYQTSKAAYDARSKADTLHRKAARVKYAAAARFKEAQARSAAADAEYEQTAKDATGCRARRATGEAEVEAARASSTAAVEREAGLKRKRDECKSSISEAKQSLKYARTQEKESSAARQTLYRQYAKADKGIKDELKDRRLSVQTSAVEQQKAVAAIQALRAEEYDANQVVEAYESRKKPRQESEAAGAMDP